jgi:hypothetical protein
LHAVERSGVLSNLGAMMRFAKSRAGFYDMSVASVNTINGWCQMGNVAKDAQCRDELKRRFGEEIKKRRWSAIAQALGVNRGLVALVYNGKTRSNKLRNALGMEMLPVKVIPCDCGKTHIHKCQRGNNIAHRRKSTEPSTLAFVQDIMVPFFEKKNNS